MSSQTETSLSRESGASQPPQEGDAEGRGAEARHGEHRREGAARQRRRAAQAERDPHGDRDEERDREDLPQRPHEVVDDAPAPIR